MPDGVIPPDIPTIDHIDITIDHVMGQLFAVDPSKAYGPDGLGPRLLKELKQVIVLPQHTFFQLSIRERKVPSTWKQANVIPIYKNGAAPIQRFNNKSLNWPAWFRHFRAVADDGTNARDHYRWSHIWMNPAVMLSGICPIIGHWWSAIGQIRELLIIRSANGQSSLST